jgi:hypothetical protein
MKRERKNGAGNKSHEKEKQTFLKKGRSYWKTKINGGTRHTYSKNATSPERDRELMQTVRSCPTRKDNHANVHSRLVAPGGGEKRVVGRLDDEA